MQNAVKKTVTILDYLIDPFGVRMSRLVAIVTFVSLVFGLLAVHGDFDWISPSVMLLGWVDLVAFGLVVAWRSGAKRWVKGKVNHS